MSNKFVEGPLKIYQNSTYTWTLYTSEIVNRLYEEGCFFSQTFPQTEGKWKGTLSITASDDYCEVELLLSAEETIHVKCSLQLLNSENKIVKEDHKEKGIRKEKESKELEFYCCLEIYDEIFQDESNFHMIQVIIRENVSKVPNDVCETDTSQGISKRNYETEILKEINANEILKNDLKMMFENKEFTYFVIKLKDSSEIPVHRSILASRSSVFSAMLKNDSSEKNEGYVNINDIGKDTMLLLLNYIYTGNITSDLSVDGAINLLSAADKYDILHLKRICGKYLANNLVISNAIDILLLSELHNVPELKNCAFKLIIDNKESFLDPVKFGKVEKQFPNLMTELVMKVFVSKT